jgi:hypothetical protein
MSRPRLWRRATVVTAVWAFLAPGIAAPPVTSHITYAPRAAVCGPGAPLPGHFTPDYRRACPAPMEAPTMEATPQARKMPLPATVTPCPTCGASGRLTARTRDGATRATPCPRCDGRGHSPNTNTHWDAGAAIHWALWP